MNILIIGSGGREHAIGWSVKRDPRVGKIWFAPGNAGTAALGENIPIPASEMDKLVEWAAQHRPDLTLVGPEVPLCLGVVDRFQELGLKIFGPNRSAARLEGSKVFMKEILAKAGIPTARARSCGSAAEALAYSATLPCPQVIKADGLAAGKGVIIAQDRSEAEAAIRSMMEEKIFGESGSRVLIEEFLEGEEMSVHAVTDGWSYRLLPSAQDHKRVGDGDQGPNTGGMGAYAPSPLFTEAARQEIEERIFVPLLETFRREGIDYRGVLYAGLMMTASGPKVLEFNARLGDPETEVLLPLLETPLIDLALASIEGTMDRLEVRIRPGSALTVVMAAPGYPAKPVLGSPITGAERGGMVFHAGTREDSGRVVTAGGRVLAVTGVGDDLESAWQAAYAGVEQITFDGAHYRRDIGYKAFKHLGRPVPDRPA
jgi:phosphoribosylamine--glycine ligase